MSTLNKEVAASLVKSISDAGYAHGPGGLLSAPGTTSGIVNSLTLPNKKKKNKKIIKETQIIFSRNGETPTVITIPPEIILVPVEVPAAPPAPYADDSEPCPYCDSFLSLPGTAYEAWYQCPNCGEFFLARDSDSDFVSWHGYTAERAFEYYGMEVPDAAPMAIMAPVNDMATSEAVEYKTVSLALATLKANYGAKAGETIQGNLARGGDGKFASGGGGAKADPVPGSNEDKAAIRARLDAAKAPKPKGGKGGKAKAAPKGKKAPAGKKAKPTKEEKQAEKDAKRTQNLSEIFSDDGADEALSAVADDPTTQLNPEYQQMMESKGFIKTNATTGLTTLTPAGKALMKAAENDDTKAMNRAVMQGKATAIGNKAVADKKAAANQTKADALRAKADKLSSKKEISIPENNLSIIKQADGKYRWITFSSSSFKDRDREIFSQAALEVDVARADKDGDYGPLRWFHVPGMDIGDCDFNAMSGRLLVESGTFRHPLIAEKMAALPPEFLEVSLGVIRGETDPDAEGVYHNIRRFERSIMPAGPHASNLFTGFMTIEKESNQMLKSKIEALTKMLGGGEKAEALVNDLVEQASTVEKQALQAGIVTKAVDPAEVEAAAAEAQAAEPEDLDGDADDDSVESISDMTVVELATLITNVVMACLQQQSTIAEATKPAAPPPPPAADMAAVTKATSDVETLKTAQTALLERLNKAEAALTKAQADLAELTDDTPKVVKTFRASQSQETVNPNSTVKNRQPVVDEYEKIAAEAVNAYSQGGLS